MEVTYTWFNSTSMPFNCTVNLNYMQTKQTDTSALRVNCIVVWYNNLLALIGFEENSALLADETTQQNKLISFSVFPALY